MPEGKRASGRTGVSARRTLIVTNSSRAWTPASISYSTETMQGVTTAVNNSSGMCVRIPRFGPVAIR